MKKCYAWLLCPVLFLSLLIPVHAAFTDVIDPGRYNGLGDEDKTINQLHNLGAFEGYPDGTFRPEHIMTRAEMVRMMVACFCLDQEIDDCPPAPFTDIKGHWAEPYLNVAAAHGWIRGYPDGTFRPDSEFAWTPVEAVAMMLRALGDAPATGEQEDPYGDLDVVRETDHKLLVHSYTRGDLALLIHSALDIPIHKVKEDTIRTRLEKQNTTTIQGYLVRDHSVIGYRGEVPAVLQIPAGAGITTIAASAFDYSTMIENTTSIVIPEGVTDIEDTAFRRCSYVRSVSLPQSLRHIGAQAFRGCQIYQINLDPALSIGDMAFAETNLPYPTYGDNGKTLIYVPAAVYSLEVPEGVTRIGKDTFDHSRLVKVTLPSTLTEISGGAFGGCESLRIIELPEGLRRIGDMAFEGCRGLESVVLPPALEELGSYAFGSCESLRAIDLPESLERMGEYAFEGCYSLESVTLPPSLTKIPKSAFIGTKLKRVVIPDSVTSIGPNAFSYNKDLQELHIPSSVITIEILRANNFGVLEDEPPFAGCPQLTIYGQPGSVAEQVAKKWEIPFQAEG